MSISDQLKTDFDQAKLLLIGHCDRIYLGRYFKPRASLTREGKLHQILNKSNRDLK